MRISKLRSLYRHEKDAAATADKQLRILWDPCNRATRLFVRSFDHSSNYRPDPVVSWTFHPPAP